jgi:hypothetical protein
MLIVVELWQVHVTWGGQNVSAQLLTQLPRKQGASREGQEMLQEMPADGRSQGPVCNVAVLHTSYFLSCLTSFEGRMPAVYRSLRKRNKGGEQTDVGAFLRS